MFDLTSGSSLHGQADVLISPASVPCLVVISTVSCECPPWAHVLEYSALVGRL